MIYYRDKVLNNLFEDKRNSDIIQKTLNYISLNPSVGEDETLTDIAYKVYKYNEFNLLGTSTKNNLKQSNDNSNNASTSTDTIIRNVEQVNM